MVAGSMGMGGIENQLMHLARNADKEVFQIDFTSSSEDAFYRDEIEKLGDGFIVLSAKSRTHPVRYCIQMLRIMRVGHYDIVHSHELFHSGMTLFLAWLAGIPCRFCHAHNWREGTGGKNSFIRRIYQRVMRFAINRFSTVQIACSSWAGEFLYGKKTTERPSYHLVFNSVDTARFLDRYDQIESGEFCEEGRWKNVLHAARISIVKNQQFLAEIAQVLKNRGEQIRILCAGDGDWDVKNSVQKTIQSQHLEEHIQLLGPRKDIDTLMRKSSAYVLPSRYEGMPLVMIEAQASGLPCVSANTYSPEVDFGIGTVTWLPLEAGAETWATALEEAVQKGRAPKASVEKAIREKRFDSKMFAQTLCDLYKQEYLRRGSHS